MNINISGEVVRTSQLPKRIIGLGDYLVALNSSPLETSTVLVSDFVSFLNTQFATSLASLTDVSINGPLSGQALVFNGSYWINQNLVSSLAGLSDVTIATPLTGQGLVYNGTKWVNQGIGELDTLNSVTTRGNTTTNAIGTGNLTISASNIASLTLLDTLQPYSWQIRNNGTSLLFVNNSGNNLFRINANGNVLIGTNTDSGFKLDVAGTIRSQGSLVIANPAFTLGGSITHTANATLVITGGPAAGGENITFGPSNRIFINAGQTRFPSGSVQIGSTLTIGSTAATSNNMLLMQGSITAGSLLGRGIAMDTTLVAAANNDVLVGLDINPTFTNGAFTGVNNYNIRTGGLVTKQYFQSPTTNQGSHTIAFGFGGAGEQVKLIASAAGASGRGNLYIATATGDSAVATTADANALFSTTGNIFYRGFTLDQVAMTTGNGLYLSGNQVNAVTNGIYFRYGEARVAILSKPHGGNGYADFRIAIVPLGSGSPNNPPQESDTKFMITKDTTNVLINTTTDAGYKLDVNGTFRTLVGTETNPFRLEHTNGNYMTMVVGAGSALAAGQFGMYFNGTPMWSWNGAVFRLHGNTISTASNPSTLVVQGGYGGSTVGTSIRLSSNTPNQGQWTATTGAQITVEVGNHSNETWAPSSGNASYTLLSIAPRINTTGTYAGIVRGLYYNPVLTSTTGVTHRAIETTSGDVIFGAGNSKLILQENVATINNASTLSILFGQSTTAGYATGIFSVATGEYNRGTLILAASPNTSNSYNVQASDKNIQLYGTSTQLYKPIYLNNKNLFFVNDTQNSNTLSMYWSHAQTKVALFSNSLGSYGIGDFRIALLNTLDSTTVSTINTRFMVTGNTYNVLIGTTTDAGYKLDVNGTARVGGSGGSGQLYIKGFAGTGQYLYLDDGSKVWSLVGGTDYSIQENSTTRLIIKEGGNVGIGTSSPFGKLDVKDGEIFVTTSTNANIRSRLTYQGLSVSRASDGGYPEQIISTDSAWQYHSRNRHTLYIDTIPHLQIGNVGISGLNIPQSNNIIIGNSADNGYKLQVNGNAFIKGSGTTSGTNSVLVQNSVGTQLFRISDDGTINTSYSAYLNVNFALSVTYDIIGRTLIGNSGAIALRGQGLGNASATMVTIQTAGSPAGTVGTSLSMSAFPLQSATHIGITYNGNYSSSVGSNTLIGYDFSPTNYATATLRAFQSSIGGVYINTTSYQASAILQADSTTQGFLAPRLTTAQKNAITTPATGLEVYDSTTNTPNYYNGTTWVGVASNQSTGLSPGLFAQTSDSTPVANTTVETTLISTGVGTLSVPANQFQVGASYIAYLSGVISSQNNATMEIHLRSNGFVLANTNPMILSAITGKFWELHVNFTIRAIGGGGVAAIVTSGRFSYNKDSGNTPESVGFSSINNTTFDTTINNTLVITATWGNASPLNSIYSRIFNLYRVY